MNHSKLIRLFHTFSTTDWEEFKLFIQSPYFERLRQQTLVRKQKLINYIQKHIDKSHTDNPQLYKKIVWRKIFPRKPYQDSRMRQEMTSLAQSVENYIIQKQFNFKDINKQLMLLEYYASNNLIHHDFSTLFSSVEKKVVEADFKGNEWHYNKFLLERCKAKYLGNDNDKKNILKIVGHLDQYYFFSKIGYACIIANHPHLRQSELPFLREIIAHLNEPNQITQQNPFLKIYIIALQLLQGQTSQVSFENYIFLLNKYIDKFPVIDQKSLYSYGLNYIIRIINTNCEEVQKNKFMLYQLYKKVGLKKGLIYINGKITPIDIRNITILILNLKNTNNQFPTTWKEQELQELLETHKDKIAEPCAEGAYQFNYARLLFLQQHYEQAFNLLLDAEIPPIVNYVLDKRRLIIKCLYELNNIDDLDREVNSFEQALRRQSVERVAISERRQAQNLHFVSFVNRIKHASTYKNDKRIQKIQADLEATTTIVDKKWLVEKLMAQR